MVNRAYYSDSLSTFMRKAALEILGELSANNAFPLMQSQRDAWLEEIDIIRDALPNIPGRIYLEFSIPRMGRRIDAVLVIGSVIFVIEFKIGDTEYASSALDQVWDYALDLKNFHESSHECLICPILVSTDAPPKDCVLSETSHQDNLLRPVACNSAQLNYVVNRVLEYAHEDPIDYVRWEEGRYLPTPTIIEAALGLYNGHSVAELTRSDAGAINLTRTSDEISKIIRHSRDHGEKSICFVTGVPGAGKTLVGLKIATEHTDNSNGLYSVFLSGNGPLVKILREALARDKVARSKERERRIRKCEAMSEVKAFIQNVHNFRDECLIDMQNPPIEHVALFDEAQRAWNKEQTVQFMRQKKKKNSFNVSEPEFLISCMDRHPDWAVIVCLVGGGQEIYRGEAGISEWINSLQRSFPDWRIFISNRLTDSEYTAGDSLGELKHRKNVSFDDALHLAVSLRSFRAEDLSLLVKQILDLDMDGSRRTLKTIRRKYPIVITRDLNIAKSWLREKARGTERYGIVSSSRAERLKPHAIDVKSPMDPVHWFLDGKEDVRSSYYLESVATEFQVQGLELDWACVTWDGDFRYSQLGWKHNAFRGNRWIRINKEEDKSYLKNSYRVLLTRARQGMVIFVPGGDEADPTRDPKFYDPTFNYLQSIGLDVIG